VGSLPDGEPVSSEADQVLMLRHGPGFALEMARAAPVPPDASSAPTVRTAAARDHGEKIVEPLYTEMGTRIHPGGNENYQEVTGLALEAAGLPAELAGAGTDTTLDATIRTSHDEAMTAIGPDLGTPVVRIDGSACFGPVLAQVPRGEAAGRIFDGVRALTGFEYFFELKRTRTAEPVFG